ncbi:hypothetical protein LSTR_LSTR000139 [Laodelphax striatellus]|uniref:Uncharacterized protein n=1 Tax=Laodelphax striatellus TaxID=195883 RepID=A0A482X682_LAOST|nr:hypothetical protein LSTR_LSTR000139 [Laodelphax striatellus]
MGDSICNEHVPTPHNEEICHATGEKRKNIVDKLKKLLDEVDDRPCLLKQIQKSPGRSADKISGRGLKDELHNHHGNDCHHDNDHHHHHTGSNMREALDENNPICMKPAMVTKYYKNGDACEHADKGIKRFANNHQMQIPAKEKLGNKKHEPEEDKFYKDCSCLRANGLQDQCPLLDCQGKEECLAVNPGPCCKPALTRLCEMKQEKVFSTTANI